jgi:hypothetical protein
MDAASRLQTQLSLNTAAIEAQQRRLDMQQKDIERMDSMVGRLQQEMRVVLDTLESMKQELRHRPMAPQAQRSSDDSTLELFATNLTNMSAKVQEVEAVKMQVEIMKRKLNRLEEAQIPPSGGPVYSSPRDSASYTTSALHVTPSVPKINTPIGPNLRASLGPAATQYHHHTAGSEMTRTLESESAASSGWTSVNSAATKRGYPNGLDDHRGDAPLHTPASPKRPKLTPMEPQVNVEYPRVHSSYERMDTDEVDSRNHSNRESFAESSSTPAASYPPYSTQSANPDDSWRPPSQRSAHTSPRRGRGGKVGRPRKSLPSEYEMGTPEWEKPNWTGQEIGPDGYYQPLTPGGSKRGTSVVRRGSGGGGTASGRMMTVEPDPGSFHNSNDPYAHTKKTRTKPTRNADGILIRKDGRPDMRSHSSAANLRKVHARKEQERALEAGGMGAGSPSSLTIAHSVVDSPSPIEDTPPATAEGHHHQHHNHSHPSSTYHPGEQPGSAGSAGSGVAPDADMAARHEQDMRRVFPHGYKETRERMDFASQVFKAVNNGKEGHGGAGKKDSKFDDHSRSQTLGRSQMHGHDVNVKAENRSPETHTGTVQETPQHSLERDTRDSDMKSPDEDTRRDG